MIVENSPKSFLWLALLLVALSGLAVFWWRDDPVKEAQAQQIQSTTDQNNTLFREVQLPIQKTKADAERAEIEAERDRNVARIRWGQWLDEVLTRLRAAQAVGWAQFWLHTAYAALVILTLVTGTASLGATLYALKRLFRRLPADPWQDPAFRRKQRELARMLEQLNRLPRQAAPAEPKASAAPSASKPSVPGGNGYKEPEPEHEMKPPI